MCPQSSRLSPEASQVVCRVVKAVGGIALDRKVLCLLLDETASFLSANRGAIFVYSRRSNSLIKVRSLPPGELWDQATLLSFFRNEKPVLPREIIMAPVRAGREIIGVLALEKEGGFAPGAGKIVTEMLKISGIVMGERRRRRALEIAWGAGEALARGLRKKDVIYRILHGARRLIDYDHSATVFARVAGSAAEIVAQQVAWAAGKGFLVGKRIGLDWCDLPADISPVGRGYERNECAQPDTGRLWESIRTVKEDAAPDKQSALLVPLTGLRRGALGGPLTGSRGNVGLLEIASGRPAFFRSSDLEAARILAPYLVTCLNMPELHDPAGEK